MKAIGEFCVQTLYYSQPELQPDYEPGERFPENPFWLAIYPVIKHNISPTRYQSRDAAEMVTASGRATFNRVKYPVMTASRMPIPPGANTNKTPMVQAKGKQKVVEKCRE